MRTLRIVWILMTVLGLLVVSNRLTPTIRTEPEPALSPAVSTAIPVDERFALMISRVRVRESKSAAGDRQIVVWGMVENPAGHAVDRLNLTVNISDGREPIARASGKPAVAALPAGGTSPFKITIPTPTAWRANWPLSVEADGQATAKPIESLAVENISTSVTTDRKIHVKGTVHNTTAWPTTEVQVWVVLIDAFGEVITGRWVTVASLIAPDEHAPVEVVFGATSGWNRVEVGALDRLMH